MPLSHDAWLGLGSNAANAAAMLASARDALQHLGHIEKVSPIYFTEPQGFKNQPWFHNQVIQLQLPPSTLPVDLLHNLHKIEAGLGRVRNGHRFGPRCIDLDILLWDDFVSDDPQCILPHPRMIRRAFVLVPLMDIAKDMLIFGEKPAYWLNRLRWRKEGLKIYQRD